MYVCIYSAILDTLQGLNTHLAVDVYFVTFALFSQSSSILDFNEQIKLQRNYKYFREMSVSIK